MNWKSLLFGLALSCQIILGSGAAAGAATPPQGHPATLLATGLVQAIGSTIGPDGALYVPQCTLGTIARVDPRTGTITTFASGLPKQLPKVGLGGVMDVAFVGKTAYALVTLVSADLGGHHVDGIYRVDGPDTFTVVADIGAFNLQNPPTIPFKVSVKTGLQFALQPYRGGFLVTDGHLNRVLQVTHDGRVSVLIAFHDIVPTGLALSGTTVYMSEAGPVPFRPQDGKVVTFNPQSPTATEVASGARLLVDVNIGPGRRLYALSQGKKSDNPAGSPAKPNTGSLVEANQDGTFTVITSPLDRPTSMQFIGNTAYVVTYTRHIWKIDV